MNSNWTTQTSEAWRQLIKQENTRRKVWMEKYGKEKQAMERQAIIQSLQKEKERQLHQKTLRQDPARKLLYEGVSLEGNGRKAYLNAQKTKSPVQKYQAPVTSNQAVGWLLDNDHADSKRYHEEAAKYSMTYNRKSIVNDTFYRSGDVQLNGL